MTDLTDRMRTCAAHIIGMADTQPVYRDAAELLIEASNIIEAAAPQPEPMEIIPPVSMKQVLWTEDPAAWIAPGGPLPGLTQSGTVSPRACPRCDSRAGKRVYRQDNHLMLACPVCGHTWEFKR